MGKKNRRTFEKFYDRLRLPPYRGRYIKSNLITFNQPVWRTKREIAGGGVLLGQDINMVGLMLLFAGELTEVYNFIPKSRWGHNVEDNAYATMRTADGIVSMRNSSATQWTLVLS